MQVFSKAGRIRAPKEQHLPVNLSGTRDRAEFRRLWKAVVASHPPMVKGVPPQRLCPESLRRQRQRGRADDASATAPTPAHPFGELP